MDAIPTTSTTKALADSAQHVSGAALLAVAEGAVDRQPSEEVLAHLFACPQCSENLHELRRGLLGLSTDPKSAPPPELLVDDDPTTALLVAPAEAEGESESRARKLIWKLALLGGLLGLGLLYLRSQAENLG